MENKLSFEMLEKFTRVCNWLIDLVVLNLLWIIFTLVGGIIFGIAPASSATCSIIRNKINREEKMNVIRQFVKYYFSSFVEMNKVMILLYMLIFISHFYCVMLIKFNPIFSYIFIVIFLWMLLSFCYFISLYSNYKMTIVKYIKTSVLIVFFKIRYTLLLLLSFGILALIYYEIPLLFIFFGASSVLMVTTIISKEVFRFV